MTAQILTQEILKELLSYNPETGVFTWRARAMCWFISQESAEHWNMRFAHTEAGSFNKNGYLAISIDGKDYLAQNLVWLYVHGRMPHDILDHEDHVKSNNKLSNLRETSQGGNCRNRSMNKNNKSGCSGVIWNEATQRWHVQLGNGKGKHLGSANNLFDAACIRKSAELKQGYHKNHGKRLLQSGNEVLE